MQSVVVGKFRIYRDLKTVKKFEIFKKKSQKKNFSIFTRLLITAAGKSFSSFLIFPNFFRPLTAESFLALDNGYGDPNCETARPFMIYDN